LGWPYPDTTAAVDASIAARSLIDGPVTSVRYYLRDEAANGPLQYAAIRAWRDNDAASLDAYTPVGQSTLPNSQIPHATWVSLDNPIEIQAGDSIGLTFQRQGAERLATYGASGAGKLHFANGEKLAAGDWPYTSTNSYLIAEFRGWKPDVLTYGDSVTIGASLTGSQWSGALNSDFYAAGRRSIDCNFAGLIRARIGAAASMNCGLGSQTAAWGESQWTTRVSAYAAPGACVVACFGFNDAIAEMPIATHQGHWAAMQAAAAAGGLTLARMSLYHVADGYTAGGHDADYWNTEFDAYNTAMASWCSANGLQNIDVSSVINDSLLAQEPGDYIHPTSAGYAALADAIAAAIN